MSINNLFLAAALTGLFSFAPTIPFDEQAAACKCATQFLGTDVDTDGTPLPSSALVNESGWVVNGSVTWENLESIKGTCAVAETACSTANKCIFQADITFSISSYTGPAGSGSPDQSVAGPESWDLTGNSSTGWSGTTTMPIRVSNLGCGDNTTRTVQILDTNSTVMATANLTLKCKQCPVGGGGS